MPRHKQKIHPKENRRKFLIDEPLPPRNRLERMHKRYDIKHIFHDFKKGGWEDKKIQMFAQKNKRTIITADKFFIKRISKETSIIKIKGINLLSIKQIDERLIKATAQYQNPSEYEGKIITITTDCVNEINYKNEKRRIKLL